MPSSDVAKYCVTAMFSASKKAGADLISASRPSSVPRISRDGVSNPLESRKNSSPWLSAETMTVLVAAGIPESGSRRQLPGVAISTRLATSARVTINSRSRVQAYWYSAVCSSGSNTTCNSAEPARNSSYSAASSEPAVYLVVATVQSVRSSINSQSR